MINKTTSVLLSLFIIFALGACSTGGGFKRTKSGLLYKIISDGKNPLAQKGEFIKVHYTNLVRDSVMQTSFGAMPTYAPVDSTGPTYTPTEIFGMLRKGDSAVIVMLADSLQRKQGPLPPYIGAKDKLTLIIKVLDVLKSEEDVRKDQATLFDDQRLSEQEAIRKYLADNKIEAEKTTKGVFVEIEKQGEGPKVDSGKAVYVNYKGQTFGGKVFDTNLDSSFGHAEPYVLVIGKRGAIEGWDDGLRLFNEGGKGKLYIPSMLAYGGNPPPGAPFKPFENLIFDVEIVDVTDGSELQQRREQTPGTPRTRPSGTDTPQQ